MTSFLKKISGFFICGILATLAILINNIIPGDIIGSGVIAILIGMALNPLLGKFVFLKKGINFTSKVVLKAGIVLMGITLSFSQVFNVGKYALLLMLFTMSTAFGLGNLLGKLFKVDWKLTNLMAVSTAICGGTAVAAVGPTIDAGDDKIAYAISSTFILDIITVIIFPLIGVALGMSDFGYGLWIGTSVNDTSSVVAAGYAFSDIAGGMAVIVKLTRTLFIIPAVIIFSIINKKISDKNEQKFNCNNSSSNSNFKNIISSVFKVFPWFILLFIGMVALRSTNILPVESIQIISKLSKLFMTMALGAIGLKTNFSKVSKTGIKPMMLGLVLDTLVVIVSMAVIFLTGKLF